MIANSGGRAEIVAAAINLFRGGGASYVVHLGDIGGRHVLDALGGFACGFIWGDKDADRMGLLRYGHSVGVECLGLIGDFEYEGKRLVAVHGEDRKVLRKFLDEQQHDFILVGHELAAEDYTVGKTRVLNPGPLHGGNSPSALLLDPATGKIKLVPL
ncbi:MAG: metallophosphoesterase family protein [Tepidisphaeraceae bacterium]